MFTYVDALFNGLTLLQLALISLFTIPLLNEKHQVEIDHSCEPEFQKCTGKSPKLNPGMKRKPQPLKPSSTVSFPTVSVRTSAICALLRFSITRLSYKHAIRWYSHTTQTLQLFAIKELLKRPATPMQPSAVTWIRDKTTYKKRVLQSSRTGTAGTHKVSAHTLTTRLEDPRGVTPPPVLFQYLGYYPAQPCSLFYSKMDSLAKTPSTAAQVVQPHSSHPALNELFSYCTHSKFVEDAPVLLAAGGNNKRKKSQKCTGKSPKLNPGMKRKPQPLKSSSTRSGTGKGNGPLVEDEEVSQRTSAEFMPQEERSERHFCTYISNMYASALSYTKMDSVPNMPS
ncbi:Transaldolase, partial [Podarcis lilfordi]